MQMMLMLPLLFMSLLNPVTTPVSGHPVPPPLQEQRAEDEVKIQVALLLDTSNSMDGLIDQAKSQLWKMVNKLADASRQNKQVVLEIALYEYGKSSLSPASGYLQQIQPLKSDLDGLSEKLFALRTNGGDEYCGWVIQSALDELPWSNSPDDLHLIIIAGNEPFNQGKVDFRVSCENATQKDIIVNTIYCGDLEEGRRTYWSDCAQIAKGRYMNINTDLKVKHIPTPYDTTLMRLNRELNDTYMGYGHKGEAMKSRQMEQDENAAAYGSANVAQRALAKSKKSYQNDDWDVVDAWVKDSTTVAKMEEKEMPQQLKAVPKKDRSAFVASLYDKRKTLQRQMADLQIKIDAFVAQERKKENTGLTLDNVLIKALIEQARRKGLDFPN